MFKHVLVLVGLAACNSAQSTGIPTVSCPTDSTLTYTSFGQAFVSSNCLSCHETKEQPTLSSLAQIQANKAKILDMAVYTDAMPQDADMAIAEREMLGEWLACGAP